MTLLLSAIADLCSQKKHLEFYIWHAYVQFPSNPLLLFISPVATFSNYIIPFPFKFDLRAKIWGFFIYLLEQNVQNMHSERNNSSQIIIE